MWHTWPTVGSSRGKGRDGGTTSNSLRSGISICTIRRGSGGNSRVRSASREGRGPSTTWIGSVSDGIGNAAVAGGSVGTAQGCGHGGGSSSGDQSSSGGRGGGDRGGVGGGVGETGGETGGGGCGRDDALAGESEQNGAAQPARAQRELLVWSELGEARKKCFFEGSHTCPHDHPSVLQTVRLLWWQGEARAAPAGRHASSGGIFSHRDIL